MNATTPDVVVLGAGPYGLAVAAHLRARGVTARVFGDPMSSWRDQMPIGMFLKSTPSASNISAPGRGHTLLDYCRAAGIDPIVGYQPVPVADFVDYGCWFAEQLVPQLERTRIARIDRRPGGFEVALDSGEELAARAVVVASGAGEYAYVPPELSALADGAAVDGPVSHPVQHRDLSAFAGRSVAVVGRGQSALETAALLNEHGADVRLLVRSPRILFGDRPADISHQGRGTLRNPESPLGPGWSMVVVANGAMLYRHLRDDTRLRLVREILGPAGGWWLRERVEGCFPVEVETQIAGATRGGDGVDLELRGAGGASSMHVDHVISATGYRVDLGSTSFLTPSLRSDIATIGTFPRLSGAFETTVPGLYFVGLAAGATFGPLMRFVCGTPFAAKRVAAAIGR